MHQRSNVLTILWMVGIRKPKAEKRKMQRTRPLIVMVISLSQRAALPRLLFFLTWQKALEARACLLRLIPHYLTQCLAATGKKRPYHLCAKRWFRICICTVLAPWNPVSSSIILYRICLFPCLLLPSFYTLWGQGLSHSVLQSQRKCSAWPTLATPVFVK